MLESEELLKVTRKFILKIPHVMHCILEGYCALHWGFLAFLVKPNILQLGQTPRVGLHL